ncbi:MAG: Hpt domain-containing protein [Gemmatimonadetes bacterium]|nr:Hpt domain-containing protein [Gemmatimonadota bacterium]
MSNIDDRPVSVPLSDAVSVSDPEALGRLRQWGGDKLVGDMVGLFLSQAPDRIAAARAGLETGTPTDVQRAVHALRSSSGQIGASRVQALCAEIESRAAGGDLTGVADLLASLEHEFSRYEAGTERAGPS